jgi:hypothetical protein
VIDTVTSGVPTCSCATPVAADEGHGAAAGDDEAGLAQGRPVGTGGPAGYTDPW